MKAMSRCLHEQNVIPSSSFESLTIIPFMPAYFLHLPFTHPWRPPPDSFSISLASQFKLCKIYIHTIKTHKTTSKGGREAYTSSYEIKPHLPLLTKLIQRERINDYVRINPNTVWFLKNCGSFFYGKPLLSSERSKWTRRLLLHLGQSSTCFGTMKYMKHLLHPATTSTSSSFPGGYCCLLAPYEDEEHDSSLPSSDELSSASLSSSSSEYKSRLCASAVLGSSVTLIPVRQFL